MQRISIILLISVMAAASASPGSDDANTGGNLTSHGKLLLELGTKYNKPLLKYLGRSLIGLETKQGAGLAAQVQDNTDLVESVIKDLCGRHRCTDWSEWTSCTGDKIGDLSMITRSRMCGIETEACSAPDDATANKTETESKLCEVTRVKTCPTDYTKTKNGFCLKYHSEKSTNANAEEICTKSGGHLVNINSQTKSDDVNAFLSTIGQNRDVWIDGYRSSGAAQWQYRYGPTPQSQGFTNWDVKHGYPKSQLCQLDDYRPNRRSWLWWSESCTYRAHFVCEYSP